MAIAVGLWQTGPGGIVASMLANALSTIGQHGLAKLFAKPSDCQAAEQLLDGEGLHVPPKTVKTWLAETATLELLAGVNPRALSDLPTSTDSAALDRAAFSFRECAGNLHTWTDEQACHALQVVLGRLLATDTALNHHLSQLRTEGKLDALFVQVLDDVALVAVKVCRIGDTTDGIAIGVGWLVEQEKSRTGSVTPVVRASYNVPVVNEALFVDRDGLLDGLALSAGSSTALTAVAGMGGVGKSTLAKVYAQRNRGRFDLVRWLRCGAPEGHDVRVTPPGLLEDLAELGDELGAINRDHDDLETRARKTVIALNRPGVRWLLIFDNAEHPDAINEWLPTPGDGCQMLLTTRSRDFESIANELSVNTFTTEIGTDFLSRRAHDKNPTAAAPNQHGDIAALVDYLGGLPLALEQAGAYVARRSGERYGSFLDRLQRDLAAALNAAPRPPGYPEPAHRTCLSSIAAATEENAIASKLLLALAYTNPDIGFPTVLAHTSDLGTKDQIDDAIAVLAGYSLITATDGTMQTHRLVQQAHRLTATELDRSEAQNRLIDMLLTVYSDAREPVAQEQCQLLLPHADAATEPDDASTNIRWSLANWAATAVQYGGDPLAAVARFETAKSIAERILGDEHHDLLSACANLANSYWSAGRIPEAITLEEKVMADSERILGREHPDTLTICANLAGSYRSAGRISEAITLAEKVMADSKRFLGDEHPDTLRVHGNLASSYRSAGRIPEAITLEEKVLADSERILGDAHPDTLTARANLASSYSSAGRIPEAITLEEKVMADRRRILGDEHPDTLMACANLANSYHSAGRIPEAIALLEKVMADRERILGDEHPDTLMACANLASSYHSAGRITEAITLKEKVMADRERILGDQHPDTLTACANLANSYHSAGRIPEAITLQEKVMADSKRILGDQHPDTLTARSNLAGSYHSAGRIPEAITLKEKVMADRQRILGDEHPSTLTARANLANSYHSAGRIPEAITLLEKVMADIERILGDEHPDTLTARANLANSYHSVGRIPEAITLQEQVISASSRLEFRHPHADSWDRALQRLKAERL